MIFKSLSEKKKQPSSKSKTPVETRLIIKYDCGFENQLYIRGQGAGLSWKTGKALKNIGSDEWIYEWKEPVTECEFKILINDIAYENGPNHVLIPGKENYFTPGF